MLYSLNSLIASFTALNTFDGALEEASIRSKVSILIIDGITYLVSELNKVLVFVYQ